MYLVSIIIIFSIVQSLFGMGLLVFGTPVLMLSGFNYSETLTYLLPSSFIISISQVFSQRQILNANTKNFLLFSILPLIVTLYLVLKNKSNLNINNAIAFVLIFFSLINSFKLSSELVKNIVNRYPKFILAIMGFVHGFSNLGGSILSVFSTCKFEEKLKIRSFIAFCYLAFALVQIIVLIVNDAFVYNGKAVYLPLISFFICITLGRNAFDLMSNAIYKRLFNIFMFMFGLVLLINK
jgi:uncharacterized protein